MREMSGGREVERGESGVDEERQREGVEGVTGVRGGVGTWLR